MQDLNGTSVLFQCYWWRLVFLICLVLEGDLVCCTISRKNRQTTKQVAYGQDHNIVTTITNMKLQLSQPSANVVKSVESVGEQHADKMLMLFSSSLLW